MKYLRHAVDPRNEWLEKLGSVELPVDLARKTGPILSPLYLWGYRLGCLWRALIEHLEVTTATRKIKQKYLWTYVDALGPYLERP